MLFDLDELPDLDELSDLPFDSEDAEAAPGREVPPKKKKRKYTKRAPKADKYLLKLPSGKTFHLNNSPPEEMADREVQDALRAGYSNLLILFSFTNRFLFCFYF